MLLTPQQFNDNRYGSPTDHHKYLALLESTANCRITTNQPTTTAATSTTIAAVAATTKSSSTSSSSSSSSTTTTTMPNKSSTPVSPVTTSNKNRKYSNSNDKLRRSFSSKLISSSSSSEGEDDYSSSEDEEEVVKEVKEKNGQNKLQIKDEQQHDEDLADDDSSEYSNDEEDNSSNYSTSEEEEEILSDDESTDKSSTESSDESESDDSSVSESSDTESEKEEKRREWMNVNSNLSLKKSVSSIFYCDDSSSDSSEDDFDSSSGQEGSFSDKDIDYTVFDDQFFLPSYSINYSPPSPKKLNSTSTPLTSTTTSTTTTSTTSSYNNLQGIVSSDDEVYNNRYYDDSEEETKREMIKKEQENDKIVLIAIRKSINGITSGSGESKVELPCWYGFEDESHIRVIFQHYQQFLNIDQEIKHTLRGPKPFIGRIHRRAIKYDGDGTTTASTFTTLDTVKVYRWEIQPIGRPLNLYKSFVLLTRWDEENGLPIKLQKVNSLSNKELWSSEAKSLKSQSGKISSYLYCSPMFDTGFTFNYSQDSEKWPVDFLPPNSPRRSHSVESNLNSLNSNSHTLLPPFPHGKSQFDNIVHQRRSSHPSLLLSSHIYSHSIIPQNGFKDKTNNELI